MIRVLLAKDLRRARRNPLPWLINLAIPLVIVALIGLTFGRRGPDQGLGRIRFGLVDEDGSRLVQMLRGGLTQSDGAKYLEPVFLDRAPALAQLDANELSAVVILPKAFTDDYLAGRPTKLQLIKNPAQAINPALLEEGLGILVAGLDAIGRNFAADLAAWRDVIRGDGDYRRVSQLIEQTGDKLKAAGGLLNPPLVGYAKSSQAAEPRTDGPGRNFNLFGYLLVGMGAMFLLFLAGLGTSDLHREVQLRTLDRFRTLHDSLAPFLGAKVVFSVVMLLISSAVLFGGGSLAFGIPWPHVGPLAVLLGGYVWFATGLMALLVALAPDQRKADVLRNIVGMGLGLMSGCAFPPDQFPAFLREQVMPLLPVHWFVATARAVEFGVGKAAWPLEAGKLAVAGAVCLALAAWRMRVQLAKGGRA